MSSITEYSQQLYGPNDEILASLPLEAEREGVPTIHIPDEIGRLLQVLIQASDTRLILELGTLFGYSSIWMARALPDDGRIISLEAEPKHARIARQNHTKAGVADKVDVREGAALETLKDLGDANFDLVFIDADKVNYTAYLDWAIRLTHPGSLILADNTWRRGEVLDPGGDESAQAMAEFNRRVASDSRLISSIVPTRDGADALTVAVVRKEASA